MSREFEGDPTSDATESDQAEPVQPMLRVINSDASPEEVAAIVAVFSALGGVTPPVRRVRSTWNHPERMVRRAVAHGPGGWRASALPR